MGSSSVVRALRERGLPFWPSRPRLPWMLARPSRQCPGWSRRRFFGAPWAALVGLTSSIGLVGWSARRGSPKPTPQMAASDRASKIPTRLLPALGVTFALFSLVHAHSRASLGIAGAACAVTLAFVGVYKHRGPNRAPCASCPERTRAATCSGLRPIVRREKALMRKTAAMIRSASPLSGL